MAAMTPRPTDRSSARRATPGPRDAAGPAPSDEVHPTLERPALPDGRPLGAHLPLSAGMVRAVERAHAIGADAIQVFADNPTAWRRRAEPPTELPAFRARCEALDIGPVAIHAAYLVNLAGPDPDLFERSIGVLTRELEVAPAFGARFVNVHIGSHRGTSAEAGVARVAEGVERVLGGVPDGEDSAILVLENAAGSGDAIGTTLDELGAILAAIDGRGMPPERVGICLDTAHLWGAGYDISTPEAVDALVDAAARVIGLRRIRMIHLNDSKALRGSRADRHQHLGAGSIGPAGFGRLLVHPDLRHVAYYLETPGMEDGYDAVNVLRARAVARGIELAELPSEALDLPGSRSRAGAG
jgi:deoxyribonuclease-4